MHDFECLQSIEQLKLRDKWLDLDVDEANICDIFVLFTKSTTSITTQCVHSTEPASACSACTTSECVC